jgi:DNA-binding transcriptional regulator YhcF (GntR family)
MPMIPPVFMMGGLFQHAHPNQKLPARRDMPMDAALNLRTITLAPADVKPEWFAWAGER